MKHYEQQESGRRFLPLLPICARIDGRSFSKFTKGLKRPYDERLSELMRQTTIFLVEFDATKNSISMAARHYYSHRELHQKRGDEMQEMLWQKGVNWNDYPIFFKRGTYVQKYTVSRPFSAEEIEKLPEKHEARSNPDLVVERTDIRCLELPPLAKVTNRVAVLFNGAAPEIAPTEE